jgi:uncharacterized membrane protein
LSGHHHAHPETATPHSAAVRRLLAVILGPAAVVTLVALAALWPDGGTPRQQAGPGQPLDTVKGTVVAASTGPCGTGGQLPAPAPAPAPAAQGPAAQESAARESAAPECVRATVRLTSGPDRGQVDVETVKDRRAPDLAAGGRVVLSVAPGVPRELRYQVVDFQRGGPLLALAAVFVLAIGALGRWRGLAALGGLVVSFTVLFTFVLPALLAGTNALAVAVTAASVIMFATLYLSHGFTVHTSTAVLGTLASLLLTGVLGVVFTEVSRFTGTASEEAGALAGRFGQVDLKGLVLAGLVIGALGVLDDVTVTQSSAVWELRRANPALGVRELYGAALRIGRDHIAATVNTLLLAYAAAALPLLMLLTAAGRGIEEMLTSGLVAEEVVRSLVGGIGLVAAVPVTTLVAALVAVREPAGTPAAEAVEAVETVETVEVAATETSPRQTAGRHRR